jgi:hypothetical protein
MTDPPFAVGAVHETVARSFPFTAVTAIGAPGMVAGETAGDGDDGIEFPLTFDARTVKV